MAQSLTAMMACAPSRHRTEADGRSAPGPVITRADRSSWACRNRQRRPAHPLSPRRRRLTALAAQRLIPNAVGGGLSAYFDIAAHDARAQR
jgi:hypothetical protein